MIEWFKSHPKTAGLVAGVGILIFIYFNRSGGAVTSGVPMSDVGMGDSLQLAQQHAQSQISLATIASNSQAQTVAASVDVEKARIASTDKANELAADIARLQIGTSAQVTTTRDTLQSQVAMAELNTQRDLAQIDANESIQNTAALTNAIVTSAEIARRAQGDALNAMVAMQPKPGLFSRIFG